MLKATSASNREDIKQPATSIPGQGQNLEILEKRFKDDRMIRII